MLNPPISTQCLHTIVEGLTKVSVGLEHSQSCQKDALNLPLNWPSDMQMMVHDNNGFVIPEDSTLL